MIVPWIIKTSRKFNAAACTLISNSVVVGFGIGIVICLTLDKPSSNDDPNFSHTKALIVKGSKTV